MGPEDFEQIFVVISYHDRKRFVISKSTMWGNALQVLATKRSLSDLFFVYSFVMLAGSGSKACQVFLLFSTVHDGLKPERGSANVFACDNF